ncbi:unnamed protein product [Rotaria sp. Silwood2]|nr:unnamed protein product [Rotaria sp. Silwood2]
MPYYVVRQGRKPGIYNTWNECNEQINRFSGAEYRKFDKHSDAQDYLDGKVKIQRNFKTKYPTSKFKISNNTPINLIKDTIQECSSKSMVSSYEKLTVSDTNTDQVKGEYTIVYSDGCCFGNGRSGSKGGYGVYWDDDHPWNISERLKGDPTNQRAELTAAISAMEVALSNSVTHLEIRTDSKYTIQSATQWIHGWKKSNWIKKTDSQPVMNKDLMVRIDELQQKLKIKWTYVAGHSSNKGNDEADRLAKAEDIIGTLNTRNRHVRIDFQDETEYNTILNSGKVSIYGQLIDCDEYLPAPKLLICSKCNTPGHTKRVCTYSQVELCRRCGKDRNGKEDHNLCEVKCHHCGGPHTSTDYSCPFIQKYRRELVLELRNRPDLLPAEAQLFIPTECRESGKITKILKNKSAQYQQFNKNQHYQSFNHLSSDHQNQWPSLPYSSYYSSKSDSNTNVNETIKSLNDELKTLKETYAAEQKKLEEKYKNHLNSMNQCWLIMQQQIQTQTEMFTSMDGIINSIVFSTCTSLMESLTQIVRKLKNDNNQNEFEPILLLLQQQLLLTNDKKSTYISHQMKLNQLAEKQRAVLDIALNSIIKQPNEL